MGFKPSAKEGDTQPKELVRSGVKSDTDFLLVARPALLFAVFSCAALVLA